MVIKVKICYYGKLWTPIMEELENSGYTVIYNQFSKDTDIVIVESRDRMYDIYPILKEIKKYNIKLVNFLIDVPPWYLTVRDNQKYSYFLMKLFFQYFYHIIHRYYILNIFLNYTLQIFNKYKITQKLNRIINFSLNTKYQNKIHFQVNYKSFLKRSNLNLSISKFTQYCFKKFLNVDSKVWYPAINSKLIKEVKEELPIKYDMINISQIIARKRQNLIVEASKKLNLKLIIIGQHTDKNIELDCPHFYFPKHLDVMKKLKQSNLFIVASIFEGFGMAPIEAAFLDKIIIASNTYIHREVLGNYPLYFIKDNLDDLVEKIKYVLDSKFQVDKKALNQIKNKYIIESAKNRLENILIKL